MVGPGAGWSGDANSLTLFLSGDVLDWGYEGLQETLGSLHNAGIKTAGAGRGIEQALKPAIFDLVGKGRVLVFSFGHRSSGIPWAWRAKCERAGIALLEDLSDSAVVEITKQVQAYRRPWDITVASIQWLAEGMDREGRKLGTRIEYTDGNNLVLFW